MGKITQFTCKACSEYRYVTLMYNGYCYNCSKHTLKRDICSLCGLYAPCVLHHIIPQFLYVKHKDAQETILCCLNCRTVLLRCLMRRVHDKRLNKQTEKLSEQVQAAINDLLTILRERQRLNTPLLEYLAAMKKELE